MPDSVLAESEWTARERAYRDRIEKFVAPHLRRAQAGEAHPVWDFLFRYYSLRPRQLRVWHPGFGVVLGGPGSRRYLGRTGYGPHPEGVTVTEQHLRDRVGTVRFISELLAATANRQAQLNCFGLHEWAMVYGAPTVRHERVPLRLGAVATDAVVESMPLRCSHFDAFRFFTEPAASAQRRQPDARRPVRLGTAGLFAREHGLIQMVLQTGAVDRVAFAGGLPGAGSRCPRARHARQPLRPHRLRVRADRHRVLRGPVPTTSVRSGTSPRGRRPCGPRSPTDATDCWRRSAETSSTSPTGGRGRLALLPAGKLDQRQCAMRRLTAEGGTI